jgi:hypothetical protein
MATKLLVEEEFLPDEISFGAGAHEEEGRSGVWFVLGFLVLLGSCGLGLTFALL